MADRTSAGIFNALFEMFAEKATDTDKAYARKIWAMAWRYDFSWEQMECNEALVRLDLARPARDADDYPIHVYEAREHVDTEGQWA